MKKMLLIWMVVIGFVGAACADSGWGVYGSYWVPGDLDSAGGVGAKISFEITPHALFDVRGTWFEDFEETDGITTTRLEMMPVDVGLSFVAGTRPLDVYVTGGYTFYSIDGSVYAGGAKQEGGFSDENGFFAGVGIEVPVKSSPDIQGATRITFMVEGLYRYTSVDEMSTRDGSYVGGAVEGPCVNAGFMLRW